MQSHVALDLYFYLNYTLTVSLLHLFLKYKIKIAPDDLYKVFVHISLTLVQRKLSTKLIPFIYSAIAEL